MRLAMGNGVKMEKVIEVVSGIGFVLFRVLENEVLQLKKQDF
jgi:hypothetical protein